MELSFWCFSVFLHLVFPSLTSAVYLEIVPDPSSAVFGQDVTMNCVFELSYDSKKDEILWEFSTDLKPSMTVWSSYQWMDQNQHFLGRTKVEFVSKKASLTLQNISVSDSGEYRCIVIPSNHEQLNSDFVKLKVSAIYLEIVPDPSSAVTGQDVTMNCMFEQSYDSKRNEILWEFIKDKCKIVWNANQWRDKNQQFHGRTKAEFVSNKASLTLQNIIVSDSGEYHCIINSSYEQLKSNFVKLTVSGNQENRWTAIPYLYHFDFLILLLICIILFSCFFILCKRKHSESRQNTQETT